MAIPLRHAEYSILELHLPGHAPANLGVLVFEPGTGAAEVKLREDAGTTHEDAEVLALLPADLESKAREMGCEKLIALFEDTLSNVVRISERRAAACRDLSAAARRLYEIHILGTSRPAASVVSFPGSVPLYSLRAAAGRFGLDVDVEPEGWVPAPEGVRGSPELFAVHILGRSMEPDVPDGSVAVFRRAPAGSRQGKRVLVWRRAASAGGGEFTLKVYHSVKRLTEDGWEHTTIQLIPLNPDYPALELKEDTEYRIIGELVAVLGIDEGSPEDVPERS